MSGYLGEEVNIRVTPAELREHRAEIDEMVRQNPGANLIVSEDTTCPTCAAAGIRHTQVPGAAYVDRLTPEIAATFSGGHRDRRKARRKAERKARRRSR